MGRFDPFSISFSVEKWVLYHLSHCCWPEMKCTQTQIHFQRMQKLYNLKQKLFFGANSIIFSTVTSPFRQRAELRATGSDCRLFEASMHVLSPLSLPPALSLPLSRAASEAGLAKWRRITEREMFHSSSVIANSHELIRRWKSDENFVFFFGFPNLKKQKQN